MASGRLVPLVMVGVFGFFHAAFGDLLLQASYQVAGDVTASGVHTDGSPDFVDAPIGASGLQADLTGGPAIALYEDAFNAATEDGVGHAYAEVGLTALASFGHLAVTAIGSLNASGSANASNT